MRSLMSEEDERKGGTKRCARTVNVKEGEAKGLITSATTGDGGSQQLTHANNESNASEVCSTGCTAALRLNAHTVLPVVPLGACQCFFFPPSRLRLRLSRLSDKFTEKRHSYMGHCSLLPKQLQNLIFFFLSSLPRFFLVSCLNSR